MRLQRMSLVVGNSTAVAESGYGDAASPLHAQHEAPGRTVVVGVRLDSQSRELLTWALVKVAQSGDRVIALHVIRNSGAEGTSLLLSLVKTFDSVLAVYEGFCNLKQVDLKLKVCRGDSVKKLLVKEAKAYAASKLILGISRTPHTIRSSVSVAKYCARKLAPFCWVLAVDNGKIVFMREATIDALLEAADTSLSNGDNLRKKLVIPMHQTVTKKLKGQCVNNGKERVLHQCKAACVDTCTNCGPEDTGKEMVPNDEAISNSLALVPFQRQSTCSAKFGWSFIRRMFGLDWATRPKSNTNNLPGEQWALKLPNQHSLAAIYPDQKQNRSAKCKENGAIIAVGIDTGLAPLSPYHDLNNLPKELECLPEKYSSMCRLFCLQELLSATSSFVPENMVGRGGSSWVYRGCLADGKELAVKVLKPSEDIIKEFVSEIEIITTVSHKNIVSLFGFCLDANYLLLVYDYLPRGSLEENLHGVKKDTSTFRWNERYKVALGVAEALDYLHNGSKEPVIHRDVKSSNILLSDDFEPQLSDFGLAQWASASSSDIVCTDVAGTFGYLAPEYFMHGKVTNKIDVYAFGVVLLELLSGRKPISGDNPKGQESLVIWAKPILEDGKLSDLLDPSLSLEIDSHEIERMALAARLCIRRSPRLRPQMSIILRLLQGDSDVTNWATQQAITPEVHGCMDDDLVVPSNIQSHLNLALLDLEDDDALSVISTEQNVSLEDYLQGRWSRQSSFD
uniref:Protein kinase domain-containing protein n=1 Tax=Kalanchoe fedtschenkoi TaxID=63787 RepID=A0A7N0TVL5_KALFE